MTLDSQELPHLIIGACMEVHRHLGPGHLVEAYRDCLALELRMKEIVFQRQAPLPYYYKGLKVETGIRVDFLIEQSVIVAVESVSELTADHKNRLKSQLKLTGHETGLLINFNVENLRDGVKRIIVSEQPPPLRYRQEPAASGKPALEKRP